MQLYERDNEARFDLQDRWLANMDAEVLAWALHHYPPEKLERNPLVKECDTPLEKEQVCGAHGRAGCSLFVPLLTCGGARQMKQVLLKTMLRTGVKDKKHKKAVEQMVKVQRCTASCVMVGSDLWWLTPLAQGVSTDLAVFKKEVTSELESLRAINQRYVYDGRSLCASDGHDDGAV